MSCAGFLSPSAAALPLVAAYFQIPSVITPAINERNPPEELRHRKGGFVIRKTKDFSVSDVAMQRLEDNLIYASLTS